MATIGDLGRFETPRQLMAYLGLVPSEHSSGNSVRRGGITKAGSGEARQMLVEAAWSYRYPPRVASEKRSSWRAMLDEDGHYVYSIALKPGILSKLLISPLSWTQGWALEQ
jgi:hypothetical protein